ncbi:hypothetical protein ACF0H5_011580 [Mactra antiquata]
MYPRLGVVVLFTYVITPSVNGKLPDLATLCPYNDFCKTKATKTLAPNVSDVMPCCTKCSCEPDCDLFGTCCPDKELTPGVQVKYPCIAINMYYNAPRNIRQFGKYDVYYHVINDCPTSQLLAKYPRCSQLHSLRDFVFVSDPLTGRIYQNRHCAMCNGVMNYTEWYLTTNCADAIEDRTWEEWSKHVMTSCEITPLPPDYSAGHEYRCYGSTVRHVQVCNYTGVWKTMDTEIQVACEYENPKLHSIYHHDVTNAGTITYQSPYCKLCNSKEGEDWSDLCKQLLPPFKALNSRHFKGIGILINFFNEDVTNEERPQCSRAELWDPFQKSCMAITCPVSTIHHAGKCEDMFARFPEETYDIYFLISTEQWQPFSYDDVKEMYNIITDMMPNENCFRCGALLLADLDSNTYINYQIRTQDGCSEDYLISRVKLMLKDNPNYNSSDNMLSYRLVPDIYVSQSDLPSVRKTFVNNNCRYGVHLNHRYIEPCPRILIEYLDLRKTLLDSIDIQTENDGTLCVDEYFKIMQTLNGSNTVKQYALLSFFVMIVTYSIIHI